MKKFIGFFLSLIFSFSLTSCRTLMKSDFSMQESAINIDYAYFAPANIKEGEKLPLILGMPGRGEGVERYMDMWKPWANQERFIIAIPVRTRAYKNNREAVKDFVDLLAELERRHPIDPKRVYLVGVSVGGVISRTLLTYYPEKWRGVVFACSPPNPKWVEKLSENRYPPMLYFHGKNDAQFEYDKILEDVTNLRDKGYDVMFYGDEAGRHWFDKEWNLVLFAWLKKQESRTVS